MHKCLVITQMFINCAIQSKIKIFWFVGQSPRIIFDETLFDNADRSKKIKRRIWFVWLQSYRFDFFDFFAFFFDLNAKKFFFLFHCLANWNLVSCSFQFFFSIQDDCSSIVFRYDLSPCSNCMTLIFFFIDWKIVVKWFFIFLIFHRPCL